MAFDGFTVCSIVQEMRTVLIGGRLSRIMQPEADELSIVIKAVRDTYYLTLSSSASLPLVCIRKSPTAKANPATAPNFCMLLRKHIGNGRIVEISQPGLERIIDMEIEHLNEMGDLERKHLVIELMGKHSNIIFCNDSKIIIDSIKHIPASVSSVREVLPGRNYFVPETIHKFNPYELTEELIKEQVLAETEEKDAARALYSSITGFSPFIAEELVYISGIDSSIPVSRLSETERFHLARQTMRLIERLILKDFDAVIVYQNNIPVDYAVFPVTHVPESNCVPYDSISELLIDFYSGKEQITRIRQKSADLRRIIQTNLERAVKKCDLQKKQWKDTRKRDTYRLYGDLLSAYGYGIEPGLRSCVLENFYDGNREIQIPLDETMTPQENAKRYYEKYSKLKRTKEALDIQIEETEEEIAYLTSVKALLEMTMDVENLNAIKSELAEAGYVKRTAAAGKGKKTGNGTSQKGQPYHYISSDGYHMYVGKNNLQNDELTFRFATGNDLWFHVKGAAGSHVIVKIPVGEKEIPDRVYEEAGALAAYYSSRRDTPKVEVDYIERKHLKKPPKAKPGYVIYHTNYSLMAVPVIDSLGEIK